MNTLSHFYFYKVIFFLTDFKCLGYITLIFLFNLILFLFVCNLVKILNIILQHFYHFGLEPLESAIKQNIKKIIISL